MAWAPRQTRGLIDESRKIGALLISTQATEVRDMRLRAPQQGTVVAAGHERHAAALLRTLAGDFVPNSFQIPNVHIIIAVTVTTRLCNEMTASLDSAV